MWSLYENINGKEVFLEPLVFSNGKSQEDIVKEVVEEVKKGTKIIFMRGVCGTGKSSIALNIIKELGKGSVVVPVKALQKQYERDYVDRKYLKREQIKLKIKSITGRKNHSCPYLLLNKKVNERKKEVDAKLDELGIFGEAPKYKKTEKNDSSCDNPLLPCKIELKDKNLDKIKEYLEDNPNVKESYFSRVNEIKRISIAQICPYWSPVVPLSIDIPLDDATIKTYKGLEDKEYGIYKRKIGCGYYDQFESYADADVIIFNSEKYKIETLMDRKPATDIEIIDECDEFLDSLSNQEDININRLNFALGSLFPEDKKTSETISELVRITGKILKETKAGETEIIKLQDTPLHDVFKYFLKTGFMDFVECDEENYCYHCDNVARTFHGLYEETYVSFHREERDLFARLVTTNLEKRFKEIADKNKALVLMSGTIHSEKVLKDIFGIDNFKIIDAESQMPGQILEFKTGYERDCRYQNFKNGKLNRGQYLFALSRCISQAKRPVLVHVIAFKDLPSEKEAEKYKLDLITQEELMKQQGNAEEQVEKFKKGEIRILYTTKCGRGADFPGEMCNSIVLTRFPYPNVSSLFWKVLKRTKPEHYNNFYIDKARREFLQKIYRGLRSKDDSIYLLSPDSRVFHNL